MTEEERQYQDYERETYDQAMRPTRGYYEGLDTLNLRIPAETETVQHVAGFAAHIRGTEFSPTMPDAWQAGWLDAQELGEFAPLVWLRMEAEV